MRGFASAMAAAWLSIAPLTAVAAPAPQSISANASPANANPANASPPNAKAPNQSLDRSAMRYAQFDAARPLPAGPRKTPAAQMPTKVYLLRGFLNVFSLGMDGLATKLQADGISATVTNHADADIVTSRIVSAYNAGDRGPVVLIGHSLGADAIVEMADALARYNIPVALMVLFDGTAAHQIPANVTTAINYTRHFMIGPGPGSRASISNVDLSGDPGIDHLTIDTAPALQAQTLQYVLQAASAGPPGSRPTANRRRRQ
jgi:hypothetical protein